MTVDNSFFQKLIIAWLIVVVEKDVVIAGYTGSNISEEAKSEKKKRDKKKGESHQVALNQVVGISLALVSVPLLVSCVWGRVLFELCTNNPGTSCGVWVFFVFKSGRHCFQVCKLSATTCKLTASLILCKKIFARQCFVTFLCRF